MTNVTYHAIVYGPQKTRRFGIGLGVNLAPSQTDGDPPGRVRWNATSTETVPVYGRVRGVVSPGVVVTSVARRLIELSKLGEKLDAVVVAGDGDPTMHPNLLEITENLRDLRNKWFAKAALCLVSDSRALTSPELRQALSIYDRAMLRFEWGTAKTHAAFVPDSESDYKTIVERLAGLDHRWIAQATFVQGALDNSSEKEVAAWLKKVEEVRPREVHLTTLENERGAKTAGVKAVSVAKLEEIASKVTEKLGLTATVIAREPQPA
jgi:wyosine [tRNA(Phe)-imidazoG37] synthetase (radical SAM superfamily)